MTTHCSAARPVWKSRPIAGSAIPTTVASIDAIADPNTVATSTHRPDRLANLSPTGSAGCCATRLTVAIIPPPGRHPESARGPRSSADYGLRSCSADVAGVCCVAEVRCLGV